MTRDETMEEARKVCGQALGLGADARWPQIERALYKGTNCGAWITHADAGQHPKITIGSIVEGVEQDAEAQLLTWPFTAADVERAIDAVEADAKRIWDETHGCESCGPENPETGYRAINPKCPACHGEGAIL